MKSSRYVIFSLYFVTNKYVCYRNVPRQKTFPMNTNILYLWSQKIITKMSKWINYWLHVIMGLGTHAVRDALWSRWCLRWSVVSCCVSQRFKQLAHISQSLQLDVYRIKFCFENGEIYSMLKDWHQKEHSLTIIWLWSTNYEPKLYIKQSLG